MRIGQNPAKNINYVKKTKNITVAIITYIPILAGFYEQNLDILKASLNSLLANTKLPFDLLIFDNGSCAEVKNYLLEMQDNGSIQFLTLSDNNIGKGGGWNFIFNSAPGDYIAYADADIEFHEGWLTESMEVLEKYPNVGMVTGRPLRTPKEHFSSVIEWANGNPDVVVEKGSFIDWEIYFEHTLSIGFNEEQSRELFHTTEDVLIKHKNLQVLAGAAHFQFTGRKEVFNALTPFNMDRPMGQVRQIDIKLNDLKYLRLCLKNRRVTHLGNTISLTKKPTKQKKKNLIFRVLENQLIKKILLKVYNEIFNYYYRGNGI